MNRRSVLRGAAAMSAASYMRVMGANERVQLGLIGCGDPTPANVSPNTSPYIGPSIRPAKLGLCAGCHGDTGKAVLPDYPNLTGQNQRYLRPQIENII